ncbi:hypothetical protein ACHAWC_005925 [Mediolabrus comicus]
MSQSLDDVPSDEAAVTLKAAASTGDDGSSDIKDYSSSLAASDDDDRNQQIAVKTPSPSIVSPWEQFNKSMQREIFSNERPSWREEWFGVHLPPSAVARGGATVDDDSVVGHDATILLPNPTAAEENVVEDDEHDLDASNVEVKEEVQRPSKPSPPESTFQSPPPEAISTTPSLSSLLLQSASTGPSIPLYPLLILLTTIYLIKKILHCLFSYKSRTHVKRSMNKVVFWKRHDQFTISQEELVRHLDWMKRRSDLRREREKQKQKKKNVDKKESTKDRDDFDKDDGRGSGGEGRYDNAGGNSDGGDGGGQQNHH